MSGRTDRRLTIASAEMYQAPDCQELVDRWRSQAATLRLFGASAQADVLDRCTSELETTIIQTTQAPLTLGEAAQLGGYSTDHLGRLVREGKIPNAGRPGAPRIARKDVPIKAGVARQNPSGKLDLKQIVRSAINAGA